MCRKALLRVIDSMCLKDSMHYRLVHLVTYPESTKVAVATQYNVTPQGLANALRRAEKLAYPLHRGTAKLQPIAQYWSIKELLRVYQTYCDSNNIDYAESEAGFVTYALKYKEAVSD